MASTKRRPPWPEHASTVARARYQQAVADIHAAFGPTGDHYTPGDYATIPALRDNAAWRYTHGRYDPIKPSLFWRLLHPFAPWPTD